MLVLSRKVGEKLIIGEDICVELIRIQGNRISLGLSAPANVKILRAELEQLDSNAGQSTEILSKSPGRSNSRMEVAEVKIA